MEAEPLNIVEINGHQYHIGHLSAEVGSYLLNRLIKQFRKMLSQLDTDGDDNQPETEIGDTEFSESLIMTLMTDLDFDDFKNLQRHALLVVTRTDYVGEKFFQQPIILRNGQFSYKELSTDIGTVQALTAKVLYANLGPFFTKAGLKAVLKGEIPAFNQQS
jgi:hypothetical protein